jgi:ATP-dependent protease ClpP protease subunit
VTDDNQTTPPELQVPRFRFWGDKKPPENRADVFSVSVAPRAAAGDGSSSDVASGSVATLRIYGPIDSWGGWWGISAKDVAKALDELPADVAEVRLRINSPGGEAWEGMAILNMLRAHRARAVAVVDGIAASAASVIAVGCDETVMSPGTQLMIHDASAFAYGDSATMEKAKRMLDSVSNSIASVYAGATGGTTDDWRAVMVEETWYTADEAVTAGLAARVAVVKDAGATETAGENEPPVEPAGGEDPANEFDLSIYAHAGRAHAPAPKFPTASAEGSTHTEGGPAVAFSDEQITSLRQKLGVAEDADEATIMAALDEALDERAEPTATGSTTAAAAGATVVDQAVLEQLRADAQAGREARQQQLTAERDTAITAAITAGKTPPARRDHWAKAWDADPEGTRAVLDALEPGLVPVAELGHEGSHDTTKDANVDDWVADFVKGAI